ncbi:MAG: acetyl-CoA carboxylase biotin carboxylase subunit [Gammaproteobacteria bacterium]|nr:acetyl-CoA carboxylase biotin carboxylase subunit [Gammaproteobacteria bacterium]NNF61616.1 acetyl-CoA carboxylase biotin carboxylase subunit [Gammaproteobacteria bacterium]NNM21112.1 acetyl-CoA carboxylase biotin carboxylase subunit [Gammaproteobacteria bacterium]
MFDKILIANRGEIACRIIDTCRHLGVATVAVYSDADVRARHVRLADEAIHIGPAEASRSYLSVDALLAAAHATGAHAVHPGYGFLSESSRFAERCAAAGLAFIGPAPQTIAQMGSKAAAKALMDTAGVPTIPGYHGEDQSLATLQRHAQQVGFPLLVKASAGGGGKGMRIVHEPGELAQAIESAQREARSAFGDDQLLLEKYLQSPRHIEFQVFGDTHGNIVHLNERECSIQRRYQKIIEESPSPFLDAPLRERMGQAAVAAARAVNYCNAGTVEFIVDRERNFYFLEMNTRLQVEHPVTELTSGQDLVEWQLRVACGEPLPLTQEQVSSNGHAIEVRIYAEDPAQDFLPSTGRIDRFCCPAGDGTRLDTGFEDGDFVSIHYDPMIAKLICAGADRQAALTRMRHTLANTAVFGPATNLDLLRRIAADAVYLAGEADTGYIDANLADLLAAPAPDPLYPAVAAVAEVRARELKSAYAGSPWDIADGWQANGRGRTRLRLEAPGQFAATVDVSMAGRNRYRVQYDDVDLTVTAAAAGAERLTIEADTRSAVFGILRHASQLLISSGETAMRFRLTDPYPAGDGDVDDAAHPGSPMPGRIVAIRVAAGDRVEKGQPLVVLEGMKMEFTVQARTAGTVEKVLFAEGEMVDAEVPLVDIAPDQEAVA